MVITHIDSYYATGACCLSKEASMASMLMYPKVVADKMSAPLFNCSVRGSSTRSKDSVQGYSALILDIDGGANFDDVCNDLKHFEYYAYTSYSHKPEMHKFRIILPLKKPLAAIIYHTKAFKEAVATRFPYIDPSSASPDRFFFYPCKTQHYTYKVNTGTVYDIQEDQVLLKTYRHLRDENLRLEAMYSAPKGDDRIVWLGSWNNSAYLPVIDREQSTAAFKRAVAEKARCTLDSLPWHNRGGGVVHETLMRVIANMYKCEFTSDEVENVMSAYTYRANKGEIEGMIKSFK